MGAGVGVELGGGVGGRRRSEQSALSSQYSHISS